MAKKTQVANQKARAKPDQLTDELKRHEEKLFFYSKAANADFEWWAKYPHWTPEESIALSFGKNPDTVNWSFVQSFTVNHISNVTPFSQSTFASEYKKRRELILRSVESGQLGERITPEDFLSWTRRVDIALPPELERLITAHGMQNPDVGVSNYQSPYLRLMEHAIEENQISVGNQGKQEALAEWFLKNAPSELKMSKHKASMMATFVRLPESGKGGNRKMPKKGS